MKLSLPRWERRNWMYIERSSIKHYSLLRLGRLRNCADLSCTKKISSLPEMAMMKISASFLHGMDAPVSDYTQGHYLQPHLAPSALLIILISLSQEIGRPWPNTERLPLLHWKESPSSLRTKVMSGFYPSTVDLSLLKGVYFPMGFRANGASEQLFCERGYII